MEKGKSLSMSETKFVQDVRRILEEARNGAYAAINSMMTNAYWLVGKRIVEEEQKGKERAEYGRQILVQLAEVLMRDLGRGFSVSNLKNFRQFYLTFPDYPKFADASGDLTWSHYQRIMKVDNRSP